MRRWLALVLLMVVAMGVVSGSKLLKRSAPVVKSRVESSTSQLPRVSQQPINVPNVDNFGDKNLKRFIPVSQQPINVPNVDPEKLFAHVKQLNFERYTQQQRDRTRTYLTQSLKKWGFSPTLQPFAGGINIFAQRQGTDPDAGAILLAAHYDTVSGSPGADDNASGVAVVLEVARLLSSRPTPRTLQIAFFDREELGLLGSRAFVANPTNLKNLHGVIVIDMVGFACYTAGCQKYPTGLPITPPSDRGDFLAVVGDTEHLGLLNAFQQEEKSNLPPVLTLPVPLKGMLMPDTLRSDHAPFWYQGVGAVLLTDTANLRTPHYHQPSDTLATINKSFFTGSAQIIINATTKLLN